MKHEGKGQEARRGVQPRHNSLSHTLYIFPSVCLSVCLFVPLSLSRRSKRRGEGRKCSTGGATWAASSPLGLAVASTTRESPRPATRSRSPFTRAVATCPTRHKRQHGSLQPFQTLRLVLARHMQGQSSRQWHALRGELR